MLILVKIFQKTLSLIKIYENLDFCKRKFEKFWFWSISMKISILINKKKWEYRFWTKLSKNKKFDQNCREISISVKMFQNSRFWLKLTKMSILVEIEENVDFSQKFRKMSIWIKFFLEILDISQNCRKFSILVKIYQNVDFGHNWRKFRF